MARFCFTRPKLIYLSLVVKIPTMTVRYNSKFRHDEYVVHVSIALLLFNAETNFCALPSYELGTQLWCKSLIIHTKIQ